MNRAVTATSWEQLLEILKPLQVQMSSAGLSSLEMNEPGALPFRGMTKCMLWHTSIRAYTAPPLIHHQHGYD